MSSTQKKIDASKSQDSINLTECHPKVKGGVAFWVGDRQVGKTCLIASLHTIHDNTHDPTSNEKIVKATFCFSDEWEPYSTVKHSVSWMRETNHMMSLTVYEHHAGNGYEFRGYVSSSNIAVVQYAVTDRISFENASYWIDQIMFDVSIPILLVGAMAKEPLLKDKHYHHVSFNEGSRLAKRYGVAFVEADAATQRIAPLQVALERAVEKYWEAD